MFRYLRTIKIYTLESKFLKNILDARRWTTFHFWDIQSTLFCFQKGNKSPESSQYGEIGNVVILHGLQSRDHVLFFHFVLDFNGHKWTLPSWNNVCFRYFVRATAIFVDVDIPSSVYLLAWLHGLVQSNWRAGIHAWTLCQERGEYLRSHQANWHHSE